MRDVEHAKMGKTWGEDEYNDKGIPSHCYQHGFKHSFNFDAAEFLDRESHWSRRLVKESIYIAMEDECCNLKEGKEYEKLWGHFLRKCIK